MAPPFLLFLSKLRFIFDPFSSREPLFIIGKHAGAFRSIQCQYAVRQAVQQMPVHHRHRIANRRQVVTAIPAGEQCEVVQQLPLLPLVVLAVRFEWKDAAKKDDFVFGRDQPSPLMSVAWISHEA